MRLRVCKRIPGDSSYRASRYLGLEGVLRRDFHQAPTQFLRSETEARGRIVLRRAQRAGWRRVGEHQCGLRCVSGAEAVKRMVEEVETCNAEAQAAFAA